MSLGIISAVLIIIGAQFVNLPEGFEKKAAVKSKNDFTTAEMIKTPKF